MRTVNVVGSHFKEIKTILESQKRSASDMTALEKSAVQAISFSINPNSTKDEKTRGLLYGMIQSGKTSVMMASAALAVDNGYKILIIFTSDINPLYDQTLSRIKSSLRGINVIGKDEWKNHDWLKQQVRSTSVALVCSKNQRKLSDLHSALVAIGCGNLPAFIIDDEADQASLNTYNSQAEQAKISRINQLVSNVRRVFGKVTFMQVTATPQALFLQIPDDHFRPTFTVLSEPGEQYVGGDQFFGDEKDDLLRYVDLEEVELLKEESEGTSIPTGLAQSLYTFLVAAAAKIMTGDPNKGYSYFCHITLKNKEQERIVEKIESFKETAQKNLKSSDVQATKTYLGLRAAYDDLIQTDTDLPQFTDIVAKIPFYLGGASIKLINSISKHEVSTEKVFNLLVGGNKLGRGVTIENLLVSYYGRNPRRPNSDTVLQHARMYGYRIATKGVTRLFLPKNLALNFESIHLMEKALRDHLRKDPQGGFEGILLAPPVRATRRNVINPNKVIYYVGSSNYNPLWPLRTPTISSSTRKIDAALSKYQTKTNNAVNHRIIGNLISLIETDKEKPSLLWNKKRLQVVLNGLKTKFGDKASLVVIHRQGQGIQNPRRETQGILSGGEKDLGSNDKLTLFMIRQPKITMSSTEMSEVWWPQIRFPDGRYFLAFTY